MTMRTTTLLTPSPQSDLPPGMDPGSTLPHAAVPLPPLTTTFNRHRALIAVCFATGLAGSVLFLAVAPKKYTASATVFVDFSHPTGMMTSQAVTIGQSQVDPAAVQSQIDILGSEHIATLAINRLGLLKEPGLLLGENPVAKWINEELISLGVISPPSSYEVERDLVEAFMKATTVKKEGKKASDTFVINVSFDARTPELAARGANEIVKAYLADRLDARFDVAKTAHEWFTDRVRKMREIVVRAEEAAQRYKAENNIHTVSGTLQGSTGSVILADERNLSHADQSLGDARNALADARARLDRLDRILATGDVQSVVPEALNSPVIQKLRSDYADFANREQDLKPRVSPDHYSMAQVKASLALTQRLILDEVRRIRASTENEVKVGQSRVETLEAQMQHVADAAKATKERMVKAAELDREAAAVRDLYQSFMSRFQLTEQEQSYPVSEARIVNQAQPPIKQSRKRSLILALGGALGLVSGCGAAWLKERGDRRIRSGLELAVATGAHYIGSLPSFSELKVAKANDITLNSKLWRWLRDLWAGARITLAPTFIPGLKLEPAVAQPQSKPSSSDFAYTKHVGRAPGALPPPLGQYSEPPYQMRYATTHPLSAYAHTVRSCKVMLQQRVKRERAVSVGISSLGEGEGKSTVASNLAQHLAQSGYRTLLIDCDLHKGTISAKYEASGFGLLQNLGGSVEQDDFILSRSGQQLYLLPSGAHEPVLNSEDRFLAGFAQVIARVEDKFDFIVLDFAALRTAPDLRIAAASLDAIIIVAESGKTHADQLAFALGEAPDVSKRVIGCVLNKTEPSAS